MIGSSGVALVNMIFEPLVLIAREFREQLSDYQFIKKDYDTWSQIISCELVSANVFYGGIIYVPYWMFMMDSLKELSSRDISRFCIHWCLFC
jgi:hypothetical protein